MSPANRCTVRRGRLLEVDVARGYQSVRDVDDMIDQLRRAFSSVPVEHMVVIAADWRPCRVFSQEVAERVTQMLRGTNPRVERSAILCHPQQHTSVLQTLRLVHDAGHPSRRLFRDPDAMIAWLGEVLSPAEHERLRAFIRGTPRAGTPAAPAR